MYYRSESGTIVGILGDFDLASDASSKDHRTGTLPFIALKLLEEGKCDHLYRHDVESFFQVLVWIAARFDDGEDVNCDALQAWCNTARSAQRDARTRFNSGFRDLQNHAFTNQFQPLFETWLKRMWLLFFLRYRDLQMTLAGISGAAADHETLGHITHEKFIDILKPPPQHKD